MRHQPTHRSSDEPRASTERETREAPPAPNSTPHIESASFEVCLPAVAAIDRLDTAENVRLAGAQSRSDRQINWLKSQNTTLLNFGQGGVMLALGGSNLMYALPRFTEHPWAAAFSFLSIGFGIYSVINGMRIGAREAAHRARSEHADATTTTAEFETAENLRSRTPLSPQDLDKAGILYLHHIDGSFGAPLTARSLIGLTDCISRLAGAPESACLIRDIDAKLSPIYRGLPVQRELLRVTLSLVPEIYTFMTGADDAAKLSRSIGRIALAGADGDPMLAGETARKLHNLARTITPHGPLARADLLETAWELTSSVDPIRENLELQMREILDLASGDPAIEPSAAARIERMAAGMKIRRS